MNSVTQIPQALVFIRCENQVALGRAILQINNQRPQPIAYRSLILTAPRQGWMALLLGQGGAVDHYLMRNLSGVLKTLAFEIKLSAFAFAYRLHQNGRTVSAFESNLIFYVKNSLSVLRAEQKLDSLDLAEPVERYLLKRFQEQNRRLVTDQLEPIPADIDAQYRGSAQLLRPVLKSTADLAFIDSLLSPGFNPTVAYEHLVSVLNLPYLAADYVVAENMDGQQVRVHGFALTQPATWQEFLPEGWRRMPATITRSNA